MCCTREDFLCIRRLIDGCLVQKALKERGIEQMLEEARADNKENDAEYLKPSIPREPR